MNLATNYCQMHMHVDASSTENIKYFIEDPIAGVSCNSIPFPLFFIEKSSTKQNNRNTQENKQKNTSAKT